MKFFENNKLDDAKNCFQKVLKISPNDLRANHAMGIIYGKMLDHSQAKYFFNNALKANKNFKPSLLNLAIALSELREYTKSEEKFNELINHYPNDYNLYFQLGICLAKQEKLEDSKLNFLKSLKLNPIDFDALARLGIINKKQKKYDEAISFFLKSLKLKSENPEVFYQIGDTFYLNESYTNAIEYLNKTISLTDDQLIQLNAKERLARSYDNLGRYDESINLFKEILTLNLSIDTKERILFSLSNVYINSNEKDFDADYSLGKYYAQETLKINKNNITALNNMGITSLYMRNHDEALEFFKKAHDIEPNNPLTLKNLSSAYDHLGFYSKNLEVIEKYKKLKTDDNSLDTNYAMSLLHVGRFKEGWKYYENRWNEKHADGSVRVMPNFTKPLWNPSLGYNRVLIWGEQGIGDQILHGTMLQDFIISFKKVYLAVDPKLIEIYSNSFPNISVYSLFDETSTDFFDYHIPLCSIGNYTRQSYQDFFPLKKYYQVKNKNYNSKTKKLKCALSWKSVNGQKSDYKSTSLESLKDILELNNIDFYSIQYSEANEEIKYMRDEHGIIINTIDDLDLYNDIYGLMQFIQSCDFTITTSSSSAHLSGALNIPTYLLLAKAYGKFWYWDNNYEGKNVWYPSITRFVQKEYKNWSHPIDDLLNFILKKYNL